MKNIKLFFSNAINSHYNKTIYYYDEYEQLESYKESKIQIVFVDILTIFMGFLITKL